MGFFKKKTVVQKMQTSKTNVSGERLDKLDNEGNLPFGWGAHNIDYTKNIESQDSIVRAMYQKAKTDKEKINAILSLLAFLEDGEQYSAKCGECHLKYFQNMYSNNEQYMKMVNKRKDELNKLR